MTTKGKGRKIYKTANGKSVDLDLLISRNELTPAVGNARVNARGDELGPGGKIVRKREDVLKDYYNQTNAVLDEPVIREVSRINDDVAVVKKERTVAKKPIATQWEEDELGNFIKKGKS